MSCFRVVRYGEGEKGCAGRGAELPDRLVAVGVEAAAFSWDEGGVFDPESEFAVGADGGNEVGMDCWWEPLNLFSLLAVILKAEAGSITCKISAVCAPHVSQRFHKPSLCRL